MDDLEKSQEPTGEPAPATTPEVKTPTVDEQVKTLQAQLEATKQEKIKNEDSYKGLQRTLNKTNEELKRQSDLKSELADLRESQKIQAALIAEYLNKPQESLDEDIKTRKPDLLTKFDELQKTQENKRKQRDIETAQQEYNRQANEIWTKAQALGLPETDDSLLDIEDYLRAGNLKRAQAKIAKLEGEKKVPEKKESDEDRINRLVQERLNKALEDKGLLKTDMATPSGRTGSREDIIRRFGEGDTSISEADYLKATGRG